MTQTVQAIQIDAYGGPEQMKLREVPLGEPGPGEIRIRHHACGVNFIDVYQRTGLYPNPLPLSLGMEGAGIVEAVGDGVTHLKVGDRAAYASNPPGSYSQARVMPAKTVCRLPDAIDFETGAAMMLKGLTAQYLLKKTLPVQGLQPASGPRPWACSSSAPPAVRPSARWRWSTARRMPSTTRRRTSSRASRRSPAARA